MKNDKENQVTGSPLSFAFLPKATNYVYR